jgi:hypothetical protein
MWWDLFDAAAPHHIFCAERHPFKIQRRANRRIVIFGSLFLNTSLPVENGAPALVFT